MEVYVLSNCDTCRKALKWFEEQKIAHQRSDIRAEGIGADVIGAAISQLGWQKVLNKRSTSWRNLRKTDRLDIDDSKAAKLIEANATLMKRPLLMINGRYYTGFDDSIRALVLAI